MQIEKSTLTSGLTVLTANMPHLASAAIGLWVGVGARRETFSQSGISHMLEHMAFKGTARRSARQIAEEIEAVGGHLNAFTGREQTAYYSRVLTNDIPLALDILSDILTEPSFIQEEMERERQVIIQEIGQTQDTPDDLVFEMLQQTAYPDQAMGRSILGTIDHVSKHSKSDVSSYMADFYRAPNMTLVAAGGVDHKNILELAQQYLTKLNPKPVEIAADPAGRFVSGDCRIDRELEQFHLAIAFPAASFRDPDYYAQQVYSTILGGGMASRLFQEIRETRGLAYSVFSFLSPLTDGGMMGVYVGTAADKASQLMPVIASEMEKLTHDVKDSEVERAKAQLRAGLLMGIERPSTVIEQMGRQWLTHGRTVPIKETLEKLAAIDTKAISQVASRFMKTPPAISALGPHQDLTPAAKIASYFG